MCSSSFGDSTNAFSMVISRRGLLPVDRLASLLILAFECRGTGFILAGEKVYAIAQELVAVRLTQRCGGW